MLYSTPTKYQCRPEVCPDHVVLVFPSRLHMVHKGCGFKSKTLYSHVLVLEIIVDNDTIPSPAVGLTVLYKNITKSRMTQSIRSDYPIHSETRTLNVWNLLQLQEGSCTWIHWEMHNMECIQIPGCNMHDCNKRLCCTSLSHQFWYITLTRNSILNSADASSRHACRLTVCY